jgi:hypothetical protein
MKYKDEAVALSSLLSLPGKAADCTMIGQYLCIAI